MKDSLQDSGVMFLQALQIETQVLVQMKFEVQSRKVLYKHMRLGSGSRGMWTSEREVATVIQDACWDTFQLQCHERMRHLLNWQLMEISAYNIRHFLCKVGGSGISLTSWDQKFWICESSG